MYSIALEPVLTAEFFHDERRSIKKKLSHSFLQQLDSYHPLEQLFRYDCRA